MSQIQKTAHSQYEEATRVYYGADRDPLKFVPAVTDKNVAHELALQADRQLGNIKEEDIVASALRAQERNKFRGTHGSTDFETLKQEALNDQLRRVVVNTELAHASMAPSDFNEDSAKSGAFEMGAGFVVAPNPETPPQGEQAE